MIRHFLATLLTFVLTASAIAQKMVHIPLYLQNANNNDGSQFTWSKTAQSDNFILIWGNTVGTNPASYPDPNLAFNPATILDTMEYIYDAFKQLGFVDDAPGTKLSQYKVPVVIYGTWGPNGAQGWANGGDADGVVGAFWAHPNAMHDGGVAAHEFAHSMQAQAVLDYRATHGFGPVWNNAGIFWETHANFMRNLLYPKAVTAWGMDVYHLETWGDWKNTYENYEMLLAIMESEGIDMVNRLWRESLSNEYPLQTYKRLAGYDQARFNDSLFLYARRMATFDFTYNNIGKYFRQYRNEDLMYHLPSVQNTYSILKKIPGSEHRYEMSIEQSPEEFAYNVIPLYPENDSCAVIVKFKGHTEANAHAGWRYGFVAAQPNGTISRYSPTYSENTSEITFSLNIGETKMYLVVMGAPFDQITTNTGNDTWHGYPKHFRFPYELSISGALPEGHQAPAAFRAQLKNNGHLHTNGGGWVQNSATVASSVYVGPMAMVLGNSNISGTVRIENTALLRNAVVSGQVQISDNAFVSGGNYTGNARIKGQAFVENATLSQNALVHMRARVTNYNLSGTIEVGGDVLVYNENGNCNNGVYYRLTNYYDDKLLECDGRTANHPVNKDVNNTYSLFSDVEMAFQCKCAGNISLDSLLLNGPGCSNPAGGNVQFQLFNTCGAVSYQWTKGAETGSNTSGLAAGSYLFTITDALGKELLVPIDVPPPAALTAALSSTAYPCETGDGGTVEVQASNGVMPFQYQWSNGTAEATISNAGPGVYSLTLTDANGCTFTGSTSVALSGNLNIAVTSTPVRCHDSADGSIAVTPVGGAWPFSWLWETGEADSVRTNLDAGDYAFTVSDAAGCSASDGLSLTAPDPLSAAIFANAHDCATGTGGTAQIQVSNGVAPYQYQWNNGASEAMNANLYPGIYSVTVTDANGCSIIATEAVSTSGELNVSVASTSITCFGSNDGAITLVPGAGVGPFSFLWADGVLDSLRTQLSPGLYAVTVSDAIGCSSALELFLPEPPALWVYLDAPSLYCSGDTGLLSATAVGGTSPYSLQWSTGETTNQIMVGAGFYTITVTDQAGCTEVQSVDVQELGSSFAILNNVTPATFSNASDGSISVLLIVGGIPPYSFQWNTGDTTQSLHNIPPGDYSLTITDQAGCAQVFLFQVDFSVAALEPNHPDFTALIFPNPSAQAAQLQLEMPRAATLSLAVIDAKGTVIYSDILDATKGENSFPLPKSLAAGLYWVKVQDAEKRYRVLRWVVLL